MVRAMQLKEIARDAHLVLYTPPLPDLAGDQEIKRIKRSGGVRRQP